MALAAGLLPGFQYEITAGTLQGEVVTIVDNTPFPDSDEEGRKRKVTVLSPEGQEFYILPRLLSDRPVGVAQAPVYSQASVMMLDEMVEPEFLIDPMTALVGISSAPITDPMDTRLDPYRPSKNKVKRYISREMPNGQSDIDFLLTFTNDEYRAENEGRPANLMFKGDTQSGKTMMVEVLAVLWAEKMGLPKPMPIFTLSGSSGVTDFDLYGQTTSFTNPVTGKESLVWLSGMADLAARIGGILYLDEVNAMAERVTSSVHPLTDSRHHFINRNKAVEVSPGQFMPELVSASLDLWIIGTYNEGYRGMGDLNEAFNNRFRTIRWGYDSAVELKLIKSAALRLLGDALRTARERNSIRTPIGTAALQKVERDVQAFGPVTGLGILVGMFKANEIDVVNSIIEDRSIIVLLNEEERQRRVEDRDRNTGPDYN
jgi:hypothetical protein